jgi:D-glycero-D-manno-heptose 1,7-bisphosphate phosphatase
MRQAVILVGDRGRRLGDLSKETPEPLLPIVGDKCFLDFLIENIARHGVKEILLLAGLFAEPVEARYEGAVIRGATVRVIGEPAPSGTAGALAHARERLDDVFLMSNGDSILDMNYLALPALLGPGQDGVLALRKVKEARRHARVQLEDGQISGFGEPGEDAAGGGLISGDVCVLRKRVLDLIGETPCSLEIDIFPRLAAEGRLAGLPVGGYFLNIGPPEALAEARREMPDALRRRAVFFDRDGTLNVDEGYTHRPEKLVFQPGAIEAVRAVNDAGALAIVVTNQSGIARGLYAEAEMDAYHAAMQAALGDAGAHIDAFYHSPFHADAVVPELAIANHPDRKPAAGMLRRATLDWDVELSGSTIIGDRDDDVGAGKAAGVAAAKVTPGELSGAAAAALVRREAPWLNLADVTAALKDRAKAARAFLTDHALPLWWNVGFDRNARVFHERLDMAGQPVILPRRVRVQARQTFVYALAGQIGWTGPWQEAVLAGAEALVKFGLRADGGTNHLIASDGLSIADSRRDLYDAAFVILGLAGASRALGRSDYAEKALALTDWVHAEWRHPAGGFLEGDLVEVPPRRQNPHMHMLEAMLQLFEATGDPSLLKRAGELIALLESKWVSARWGGLLEYFEDDWTPRPGGEGRIAEPGHQFEWSWLLDRYARLSGQRVSPTAGRIYLHGEVYGVDSATEVTCDETWAEGGVRTPTSRFWPHAERIKANAIRFERTGSLASASNCVKAFDVLMTYCDTSVRGLWRDRRLPDGSFVEEAAPASSFYHAALAMAELIRVADRV